MPTVAQSAIRLDTAGVAWIDGTTTKVIEVAQIKIASGLTPEELQIELPHLSLAQVYAALAWYYANQDDLDAEIERRRRRVEGLRRAEPEPLSRAALLARKSHP